MKKIIIGTILVSGLLFANGYQNNQDRGYNQDRGSSERGQGKRQGKSIEEIKSKILSKLENRITKLNKAKSCISSASTKQELKSCRPEKRNKKNRSNRGNGNDRNNYQDRGQSRY